MVVPEEESSRSAGMSEIEKKVFEYINERLFTDEKPLLFVDLIFRFKIGPSRSKALMYSYYKQNTVTSFNCVIVTCYKNGCIKIVNDVNSVGDETAVVDCFIYAFNPMEKFIPVNVLVDQRDCLGIRNPHKLHLGQQRSRTVEEPATKRVSAPIARSKTAPDQTKPQEKAKKNGSGKSDGLRSTAILAKMRAERESKELQRQEDLKKRRKEQQEKSSKTDPRQAAQMEELASLFDEDDESMEDVNTRAVVESEQVPKKEQSAPLDEKELEDLLETTVEDSNVASQPPAKEQHKDAGNQQDDSVSSYVDEDGYIVTERAATSTPPQKRPLKQLPSTSSGKKNASAAKKTQGTLESFFKRSKK